MVDAGGHIPRCAHVPFHVGVVGEELAIRIEGGIVLIAEPAGEELDGFSLRVGFANVAAGGENAFGVAVRIPHAWDEVVLGSGDHAVIGEYLGDFGVVTVDEKNGFSVRRKCEVMDAVLAATFERDEEVGLVELVVAIGIF